MLEAERFWDLVSTLGGQPDSQDDTPYESLTQELAVGPVEQIFGFAETLAFKLYELDRRSLASVVPLDAVEAEGLSDDGFLYARCAVIVAGKRAFDAVLSDEASFAKFGTAAAAHAESILDVPSNAYERKTGQKWEHDEEYDYETGSNEENW